MTDLFTPEERENLKEALTEGLMMSPDIDIPDLTSHIQSIQHSIWLETVPFLIF